MESEMGAVSSTMPMEASTMVNGQEILNMAMVPLSSKMVPSTKVHSTMTKWSTGL